MARNYKLANLTSLKLNVKVKNLVEVTVASYQDANKMVESQVLNFTVDWKVYIPDSKFYRISIARDVEISLSAEEIKQGVKWFGNPFSIVKAERIMCRGRLGKDASHLVPAYSVKFWFKGDKLPDMISIYKTRVQIEL